MKNDNIWIIVILLALGLGALAVRNYRQDRILFEDDFETSYSEIDGKKENSKTNNGSKSSNKSVANNTSTNNTGTNNSGVVTNDSTNSSKSDSNLDTKTTDKIETKTNSNTKTTSVTNTTVATKTNNQAKKVSDITYIDMNFNAFFDSGDFDTKTGEKIDNRRRIRYNQNVTVKASSYNVVLPDDVYINVYEFDSNNKYIKYVTLSNNDKYTPSSNCKSLKISMYKKKNEKTMSPGQWGGYFKMGLKAYMYSGDLNALLNSWKGNLYTNGSGTTSATTLKNYITSEQGKQLANALFANQYNNGVYSLNTSELGDRITLFFSNSGDDNNSGLSPDYPKKDFDKYRSGASNVNFLFKAGDTFYLSGGVKPVANVLFATYGNGPRAKISYYRSLNVKFTKVSGYDNIWVADISYLSNGTTNKTNCNLGQLVIDGQINWKRYVYSSDSDMNPQVLVDYGNNGWAVDFKRSKLYIHSNDNPNNHTYYYAPSLHGFSIGGSNITVKGLEIVGAGNHAINISDASNIKIYNNYMHNIGGSVLPSAGIRYGNAVQVWDDAINIDIEYNVADWIFDTCYTNQGSDTNALQKDIKFSKNIGMHSFWGIEVWGDGWSNKAFSNIEYSSNIIYFAMDITAPTTTMYTAPSGKLLHSGTYVSYRGGYQYHQMSNLSLATGGTGENTKILNNVFAETNRFLIKLENSKKETKVANLENNTFYNRTNNAVFRQSKTYTYDICSAMSSTNKKADPTSHMNTLLNAMSKK